MKRKIFLVAGIVLLAVLTAGPAMAYRFEGTETQLTTDTADQFDPSISGAVTVYTDRRGSDADIYMFDIEAGTEVQITSGGGDQFFNDISGDLVVFTDYGLGNAEIFLYNIATTETIQVTDHPANQRNPAISGSLVVFEDDRDGDYEIFMVDVTTGTETRLTDDDANQINPAISGSLVVWEDYRNGNADIYTLDLNTAVETQVTTDAGQDREPDVDGDTIAFSSNRASLGDIYLYSVSGGGLTAITTGTDYERNPSVSGDYVAYESYAGGDADIWIYSMSLLVAEQATIDPAEQYLHDLSGNRLVFTDNRNENLDIYLFEFLFDDPPAGGEGCDDLGAIVAFGPKVYTRGHGKPQLNLNGFAGPGIAGDGYVCIANGDEAGENRVTSARVAMNGDQLAGPGAFGHDVESLEIPVDVRNANVIGVQLRGAPGSQFTLRVILVPPPADDPVIIVCNTLPDRGVLPVWALILVMLGMSVFWSRARKFARKK